MSGKVCALGCELDGNELSLGELIKKLPASS